MGAFLKGMFGGAAKVEEPQLVADTQGAADHDENEVSRVEIKTLAKEVEQSNVSADRPPDFLDNIYPPIPAPRTFSAAEVWERSNVSEFEQENVERAQQLLNGLPPQASDPVKRQIVEVAFKAFEVSIDDIVSAASNEVAALRDYIADANARAERFGAMSEERIAELEAEIERIRVTILDADEEREQLVGSALELIDEVEPVLKFFGDGGGGAALASFDDAEDTVVAGSHAPAPHIDNHPPADSDHHMAGSHVDHRVAAFQPVASLAPASDSEAVRESFRAAENLDDVQELSDDDHESLSPGDELDDSVEQIG